MRMALDRGSGKIVAFPLRLRPDGTWSARVWTFDVCANRWQPTGSTWEPPPSDRGAPGGLQVVYDEDSDLTVAVGGDGSVVSYDAGSDTLTEREPSAPEPPFRLAYDPATGQILAWSVAADPAELWSYEVESDVWTRVPEEGPSLGDTWDHALLAHDASEGLLVVHHGDACGGCPVGDVTRTFDVETGHWLGTAPAPDVNTGFIATGGEIAYDEAARRTVVFSDGYLIAYDAVAGRWETRYGEPRTRNGPVSRLGHTIVYDPVNERIVVYGGGFRTPDGWVKTDDVWAFDLSTDSWTQLLAPSEPYPEGTDLTP
jgi:hypothetical protein